MIKLAITGCLGRMGQRIYALAKADGSFNIVGLLERPDHPNIGQRIDRLAVTSDLTQLSKTNVFIDFTLPSATLANVEACLKTKTKMVIGTTGLSDEQTMAIRDASRKIPIVLSTNMSIGVNILFKMAEILADKAGLDYHVRIVEAHHVHKKDAPSGTAKTLAKIIEAKRGNPLTDIQSVRQGEIVGDHDVTFDSDVDTIMISHHAKTRDIFAKGALVAARFIAKKRQGLYTMQDVLGIK